MKKSILFGVTLFVSAISFSQNTIYVDQNATGSDNGLDWTNAYINLQSALSTMQPNDEVWVAEGFYYPGSSRSSTFNINVSDVTIYGGFDGTETLLNERDYFNNETVLSGDVGAPGNPTDNCYTVVTFSSFAPAITSNMSIDGCTIEDGTADQISAGPSRYGAGIYIKDLVSSVHIENCKIQNNRAAGGAGIGALQNTTEDLDVTITNCEISNNVARWAAAFEFLALDMRTINVELMGCLIHNNIIGDISPSSPGYTGSAGCILAWDSGTANASFINCTVSNNQENGTGAVAIDKGLFFVGGTNISATGDQNTVDIVMDNCIVFGNSIITTFNNSTYTYDADQITVRNTITEDPLSETFISTTLHSNADPLFTDPGTDNYTIPLNSPAVDAGTSSGITFPAIDLAGNTRVVGSAVDMGCYENAAASLSDDLLVLIVIYPNPATEVLTIETDTSIEEIVVFDINGAIILNSKTNSFSVEELTNGIYFVSIVTEHGTIQKSFVKN